MRTDEIGYIRYYGTFGVTPGFRLSAKGQSSFGGATFDDVDIKDQINMLNLSLTIGGGIQYIVSGNTRLVGGIEFNNGFSDLLKNKEQEIYLQYDKTGSRSNVLSYTRSGQYISSNFTVCYGNCSGPGELPDW